MWGAFIGAPVTFGEIMSNKFALKAWAEPLRSAAFGSITGTLAPLGSPFAYPARVVFFTNGTDATIYLSWNSTSNMFALLPGSSLSLDLTTNKSFDDGLYMAIGTQAYIAYESAPTDGTVYLSLVYGTSGVTQ